MRRISNLALTQRTKRKTCNASITTQALPSHWLNFLLDVLLHSNITLLLLPSMLPSSSSRSPSPSVPLLVSCSRQHRKSASHDDPYKPTITIAPYPTVITTPRVMIEEGTPLEMKCLTLRYLMPVWESSIMIAAVWDVSFYPKRFGCSIFVLPCSVASTLHSIHRLDP